MAHHAKERKSIIVKRWEKQGTQERKEKLKHFERWNTIRGWNKRVYAEFNVRKIEQILLVKIV